MRAITLLANNTLQNLLEPVAFGRTLRLHPLVVLLVTTAGTLLFGVLGATLAAPVTAVGLRTIGLLGDAGLFGVAARPPAAAAEVPSSLDGREASAGPHSPNSPVLTRRFVGEASQNRPLMPHWSRSEPPTPGATCRQRPFYRRS